MIELRASTIDATRMFSLNGLEYPKGMYTLYYARGTVNGGSNDVDTTNIQVGIRSREHFGNILQSPILFNEYTTDGSTPYTSLVALQQAMADLLGFNRASGGGGTGGRTTFTPTESPFADDTARDTWAGANLDELHNDSTLVTLITVGTSSFEWAGEDTPTTYSNNSWILRSTGLTDPQRVTLNSLVVIPEDKMPIQGASGFEDSEMRRLSDGAILAPEDFSVESGSIDFGDIITLSEATGFLSIQNHESGDSFALVDSRFTRAEGSTVPRVFFLIEPENELLVQSDTSTIITDTDFTFTFTTTLFAQANSFVLQGSAPSTNVRIRISDAVTGVTFKYLPTEAAWIDGDEGLTLATGSTTIDLDNSPLRFAPNRQLRIEIQGDSINLLGNASNFPFISAQVQRAEFRDLAFGGEVGGLTNLEGGVADTIYLTAQLLDGGDADNT